MVSKEVCFSMRLLSLYDINDPSFLCHPKLHFKVGQTENDYFCHEARVFKRLLTLLPGIMNNFEAIHELWSNLPFLGI